MTSADILLDPQLKYWVLLPISIVMVLIGLIKSDLSKLFTPQQKLQEYRKLREQQFLQKASNFRHHSSVLHQSEFVVRQQSIIQDLKSDKYYAAPLPKEKDIVNPFGDLASNDAMMSMAKANILNLIPQTIMMSWINHFFAGFVVMKLPFPLTDGFKGMLQNGIATPDLNVQYVSSISWYFVTLMGLRPIYSLIMGDSSIVDNEISMQNQTPFGGPGAPSIDKLFNAEAENIQILHHNAVFEGITERILSKNNYTS